MLRVPYSFVPPQFIKRFSHLFYSLAGNLDVAFPNLNVNLKRAGFKISSKEYLSTCLTSNTALFVFFSALAFLFLGAFGVQMSFGGVFIALFIILFIFLQQIMYPKVLVNKKIKSIERNLLPAMQNMLVQLNSGVPLFNILVNISKADYKELSVEIGKAVNDINAGKPQADALEEIAATNSSLLFRRAIWQIVNGMKSGADMAGVIEEVIISISEEQLLQIQRYGGQLNPLAMFYMLVAVIVPSLSMTFLIIISSFVALTDFALKMVFWGLFAIVFFFQLMFLGIIKSRRPNLLGE